MNSGISDTLSAGTARAEITPTDDCFLGGFAGRTHRCEGIHDPLYATALAISKAGKKIVFIAVDILALTNEQLDRLWRKAEKKFDLKPCSLFINCSHTHAGPEVRPSFNTAYHPPGEIGRPDQAYIDVLIDKIIYTIEKALENLRSAKATWGLGQTNIGINRRAADKSIYSQTATGYENFPNPDKKIDRTCPIIFLKDNNDKPISLLFGASCHPTTMRYDNYLISAEYPGVTRRILEQDLDGAPTLFLQGTAGDVKPISVAEGDGFRSGSFKDVEKVGEELANDVKGIMKNGLKPLNIRIASALKRVTLPFNQEWSEETLHRYSRQGEAEYRRVWAEYWLKKLNHGEIFPRSVELTLSIVELSADLRFLGIAGELLTDMGFKIQRQFKKGHTLTFGYTNGEIGYIPDAEVLREGGYEALETVFFSHDRPAPLSVESEENILRGFKELMEEIKE